MAKFKKTEFNTTSLQSTAGVTENALNFLASSQVEQSQALSNLGKTVQDIGYKQQHKDDNAILSKFNIDSKVKTTELTAKYGNDIEGFNKEYDEWNTVRIQEVPPWLQDKAGLTSYEYQQGYELRANSNLAAIKENEDTLAIDESNVILHSDMTTIAATGDFASATLKKDDLLLSYKDMLDNGRISIDDYNQRVASLNGAYDYATEQFVVNGFVEAGDLEGLAGYINILKDPKNKRFSHYGDGTGLIDDSAKGQLIKMATQQYTALKSGIKGQNIAYKNSFDGQLKDITTTINNGGWPAAGDIDAFINGIPENFAVDYPKEYQKAVTFVGNWKSLTTVGPEGEIPFSQRSLAEQEQWLIDNKDSITDNPGHYNLAKKIFESNSKGGIQAGANMGLYEITPIDFSKTPEEIEVMIAERKVQYATMVDTITGNGKTQPETHSFFTETELAALSSIVEDNPQMLGTIINMSGKENLTALFKDLGVKDDATAVAGMFFANGDSDTAIAILAGSRYRKANPKAFKTPGDFEAYLEPKLRMFNNGTENGRAYQRKVKTGIMNYYINLKSKSDPTKAIVDVDKDGFDDNLMDQAMEAVLGPTASLSGDKDGWGGGFNYTIPSPDPSWTKDNVSSKTRRWLDSLEPEAFKDLGKVESEYVADEISNGNIKLVPATDGTGGYLLWDEHNTKYVNYPDGSAFVLVHPSRKQLPLVPEEVQKDTYLEGEDANNVIYEDLLTGDTIRVPKGDPVPPGFRLKK